MHAEQRQYLAWQNPWTWAIPLLAALGMFLIWYLDANRSLFLLLNSITTYTGGGVWANITTLGDTLVVFSFLLLLVGRRPDLIWQVLLAAMIGTLIVHGLKEWLLVMRPPYYFTADEINIVGRSHIAVSFPSGHTTAIFTLAGVAVLHRSVPPLWKFILVAIGLLVALSRIAVGVHWPMDVMGGMFIGFSSAIAASRLAPLIPWGVTRSAQRIAAALLGLGALNLLFFHDSGYPQARVFEIIIGATCLLLALPRLRQLFTRSEEERREAAERRREISAEGEKQSLLGVAIRIVVTVAIFALIFRGIDVDAVVESFKGIVPRLLMLGLIFQLLSTLLASYRWYLVMQSLGYSENFGFYLKSYFKGSFFNQGLPTSIGGDAIRVLDVARLGFRKRDAFYGVFIDRVLGLVGLMLLNLLANLINPHMLPRGIFFTITALVVAGLLGFGVLFGLRYLAILKRWQITRLFHHISENLGKVLADWRALLIQCSLSLGVHALSLMAIFLIGRSVEMPYDLWTFMVIVPPVILLTLIPVSLAGWGVREGAMIGLFTLIGADKVTVLSMSILYGIVLIVASLPGLQVYLTGKNRI